MPSFGMRRPVALVRTDVSEERIASVIRVKKITSSHAPSVIVNVVPSSMNISA
jgi:hypothetical protein